jgi:hypothetical protein
MQEVHAVPVPEAAAGPLLCVLLRWHVNATLKDCGCLRCGLLGFAFARPMIVNTTVGGWLTRKDPACRKEALPCCSLGWPA